MDQVLTDKNTVIVADGIGVVKGGEQLGFRFKERVPGVELCEALLQYANQKSGSIYLFGAKKEVLDSLVERIEKEYTNIMIAGYTDGYVEDKEAVMQKITQLAPDLVFVALGAPQQELLIHKYFRPERKGRLRAAVDRTLGIDTRIRPQATSCDEQSQIPRHCERGRLYRLRYPYHIRPATIGCKTYDGTMLRHTCQAHL